jgi:ADP-ribosylglycohydrolase
MCILPVGLRFRANDEAELFRHAGDISALTHGHPRAQLACAFYCLFVSLVMTGSSLREAYSDAIRRIAALFTLHREEKLHFARILGGRLDESPVEQVQSSGYVIHTLEASLWCALQHTDFRSAVLAAVNLGGDTDTTGCVTGGLAGAFYGIDAIPAEWLAALPRRAEVDALLERFSHVCKSRSPQ